MYIGSEYYSGNEKICWFEPYLRNLSLAFPHGRNYYEVWPFLVCLSYDPDNIDGLDVKAVKRIINRVKELYPDADEAEIIKLIGKKPK